MTIIGLSGYAGSGKDAVAALLVPAGFTRVAFADVLRDVAYAADPYVRSEFPDGGFRFERLQAVIDRDGWHIAKNNNPDVRRLLQRLGTEAGRDILGENIWVDTAFARADSSDIVITDVRFPNEFEAVRSRGGITVRIDRPGYGPRNSHASETSLDDAEFDYYINNNGTLQALSDTVVTLLTAVRNP
jgi:hypothetical protein